MGGALIKNWWRRWLATFNSFFQLPHTYWPFFPPPLTQWPYTFKINSGEVLEPNDLFFTKSSINFHIWFFVFCLFVFQGLTLFVVHMFVWSSHWMTLHFGETSHWKTSSFKSLFNHPDHFKSWVPPSWGGGWLCMHQKHLTWSVDNGDSDTITAPRDIWFLKSIILMIQCTLKNTCLAFCIQYMNWWMWTHIMVHCSVWSNFTTGLHNHLQILQNKLACVLLHADIRTPIDKMMEELNWLKLDDRWERQFVVTFKCLKEIAPVYMSSYVTFTHSTHNRFSRNQSSNTLFIPLWNITAGKHTIEPPGP